MCTQRSSSDLSLKTSTALVRHTSRTARLTALATLVLLWGGLIHCGALTFTNVQVLWAFPTNYPAAFPYTALLESSDGYLYATAHGGSSASDVGAIFAIDKTGANFSLVHQFTTAEGDTPSAPLIQATNGIIYGTTLSDGPDGGGSAFRVKEDGLGFRVIHSFTLATNDGGGPESALLQGSDGLLYGTSQFGGVAGSGVVFRMDVGGSNFVVLHSLASVDGIFPQAALMEGTNGALYGTTYQGGQFHFGTVFRIDKSGGNFSVVHPFAGGTNDGSLAFANLITASNGRLYGTTSGGGQFGGGVIFGMDYNGSNYIVLHHFAASSGPDGNEPYGALAQGPDGALYGTTSFGGTQQKGTIFQINPDGSGYMVLVNFSGAIGANPFGGLIIGSDGAFYGTASAAGPLGRGSVFRLTGVSTGDGVLTPPRLTGGASWLISGHGSANRTYTVQFATNFSPPVVWTTLGQATADSLGNWQLTDSTNSRARFYRTSFP
jgi:uncharacterized repeat protein (TIGR03803 family)